MHYRNERINSCLSHYDQSLKDVNNAYVFGKTSHKLWRDITLRISTGEIDTSYNGLPLYVSVVDRPEEYYAMNYYDEREARIVIDAQKYSVKYLDCKLSSGIDCDLNKLKMSLQLNNVPFINVTGLCEFGVREEDMIIQSVEIAKQIRSVTSTPIIIQSSKMISEHEIKEWADRIFLFHNGRITSRFELYRGIWV